MNMSNVTRKRKGLSVIAALAVAGGLFSAPIASAYQGTPDASTGIVWGVGPHGTENIKQGDTTLSGFAIDTNKPAKDAKYGEAQEWAKDFKPNLRADLTVASYVGKIAQQDPKGAPKSVEQLAALGVKMLSGDSAKEGKTLTDKEKKTVEEAAKIINDGLKGKTTDQLVAAAGALVKTVHAEHAGQKVDTTGLDKDVLAAMNAMRALSPSLAQDVEKKVTFMARTAEGTQAHSVLSLNDTKLVNLPIFKDYEFEQSVSAKAASGEEKEAYAVTTEAPDANTPNKDKTNKDKATTSNTATASPSADAQRIAEKEADKVVFKVTPQKGAVIEKGKNLTTKVEYEGLAKGENYTVKLVTVDRANGKETGNEVVKTFEAKESNGSLDTAIMIKNADVGQQVVYAYLYRGDKAEGSPAAKIEDVNSAAMTVGQERHNPAIKSPSASSSTGDVIQSGTKVDVNGTFDGLIPGKKYRIEATLVDGETGQQTGAKKTEEFTAETSTGGISVRGIEVTKPDITLQVAFLKMYEIDNETPYLIANYENLGDAAMTIGATHADLYAPGGVLDQQGKGFYNKKKKKVAPKTAPKTAQGIGNGGENHAPAPGGGGGAAPAAAPAPVRQVINAVPSGDTSVAGNTAFHR